MGDRAPTQLHLQLLGVPTWKTEHDEGRLEGKLALMIAVVATKGDPTAAWLAEKVWGANASGTNLHTNINRLRARLGHRVVEPGGRVVLHKDVTVDIHSPPDAWPDGADPSRAEFGHGIVPSAELADWLSKERARWRGLLGCAQMLRRADAQMAADDISAALESVRRAIDLAPALPEAWLSKAQALYLSGDLAGARRTLARARALEPLRPEAERRAEELRRSLDASSAPRPRCLPASLMRPPQLVGRDAAWLAAERAWEARVPFIFVGEPGVGKTRLLQDFIQHHGGGLVIQAAFQAERAPYATLGVLVQQIQLLLGTQNEPLPPPLAAVAGIPDGRPEAPRFDEAALLAAGREWLKHASPHLGAIAVDRLERADAATIAYLRRLTSGPLKHQLRFAFAARPIPDEARRQQLHDWIAATDGLRQVAIAPWTVEQLAELLQTLDLPRAAALITPTSLHERSGGIAQLVLFSLQALTSRDTLGHYARTSNPTEPLAAIRERVRAAPLGARRLLELSAVVDTEVARLALALECSELEVLAMRDELAMFDLLDAGHAMNDMVRDEVLAIMPPAAIAHWNAVAATLLTPDPRVPRAQVAAHWEAAERWPEAALTYFQAGAQAVAVGGAVSALDLYRQSARCADLCGDTACEFDALHEALPHATALEGQAAGKRMLQRMQDLTAGPDRKTDRRVKCAIKAAMFEVSQYRRGPAAEPAMQAAAIALREAQMHGDAGLLAAAMSAYALALGQVTQFVDAIDEGRRAWSLAQRVGPPRRAREIGTDLSFIYYEASEIGQATALVQDLLTQYEAAGDVASVAALESNLGNLLARSGNPVASLAFAMKAHDRMRELEPTASYTAAVVNRVGMSQALGYKGELQAALDILTEQGHALDETEPVLQVRAMVRAQRAHLLLLMGDAASALASLGEDDADLPVSQRIQASGLRWRASRLQGGPELPHLALIQSLLVRQEWTPLPHMQWWAASLLKDPAHGAEWLDAIHARCIACGMQGVARSVAVRRIQMLDGITARWAIEQSRDLACALLADLDEGAGMQAMTYLPEAWLAASSALRRANLPARADTAISAAREWVRLVAARHVPVDRQDDFLHRNPVNASLFSD